MSVTRLLSLLWAASLVCFLPAAGGPAGAGSAPEPLHTTAWVRYGPETRSLYRPAGEPVRLAAARNETVSFQVVFPKGLHPETTVEVTPPGGEEGVLPGRAVRLFILEACIPEYPPDCLVPVEPGRPLGPGLNQEAPYRTVWVDVRVPEDQPPGTYRGALRFDGQPGAAIRIELRVSRARLPGRPRFRLDLNNYGVNFVRVWGLKPGTPEAREAAWAVYRLAREHRATFNPLPYKSQRGTPRPGMAPRLEGKGSTLRVADWSEYDRFYGPLFDGTLFDDGRPVDHQYLPFNPEWPSEFGAYLDERSRYETEWERVAQEFVRHFRDKQWTRTTYQVFMNQKPRPNNRIPWNLDEPKGDRDYTALRYYADLTHRAFRNTGPVDVRFRIDISHFYCGKHRGDLLKDFRMNRGWTLLAPAVDVWVISRHSLTARTARQRASMLRENGRTVYVYTSAPALDRPLASALEAVKRACAMGVDGIVFWNTVHETGRPTKRGTDFLIYADPRFSGLPLASLRLKAIMEISKQCNP